MHTNDLGLGSENRRADFIVAGGAGEAYARVHPSADDPQVVVLRIKPDRRTVVSRPYLGPERRIGR
jgi:hypothetical protein